MDRLWIVLIGGLLPAFSFGVAAILQKAAALQGMQVGTYVVFVGIVGVIGGVLLRMMLGESGWAITAAPLALLGGLGLTLGTGAISFAVLRMGAPISLIAPITVISTLVTVLLGFLVFREHEGVNALRLLGGALLVVAGAALVATS